MSEWSCIRCGEPVTVDRATSLPLLDENGVEVAVGVERKYDCAACGWPACKELM